MVLHKRSDKAQIKKVQTNCRRLIFARWRYLVGAAIPQTVSAVQFHLRTFFTAFRKVTVSRRGVRRQRELIQKAMASNAIQVVKMKQALKKMKAFAQLKQSIRSLNLIPKEARLRKFFEAWKQQMDWLKMSKVNLLIQKEFIFQKLARKTLRALHAHKLKS